MTSNNRHAAMKMPASSTPSLGSAAPPGVARSRSIQTSADTLSEKDSQTPLRSTPGDGPVRPALLLASGNTHKLAELRRLLAAAAVDLAVLGLADVPAYDEPAEDGVSFEDNALIKAEAGYRAAGLVTLADDSGIEVDVLSGMPGVRSARWAGPGAGDQANLDLLLRQLSDVATPRRTARFVCAVALVGLTAEPVVLRRSVEGSLLTEPRGSNGFGYDPIFLPAGSALTTAEMPAEAKDAISHRGQAMRALLPWLEQLAGES